MKYVSNEYTTSQQTPYGDMAEQAYDNGFSPIPLECLLFYFSSSFSPMQGELSWR